MVGVLAGGAVIGLRVWNVFRDRKPMCLVFEDNFNGVTIDSSIWMHEVEAGGYGNHEV
jgi:hypothetical protein